MVTQLHVCRVSKVYVYSGTAKAKVRLKKKKYFSRVADSQGALTLYAYKHYVYTVNCSLNYLPKDDS